MVNKVFTITRREFLKYIRSKWFRVFFILPLISIILIYLLARIMPEEGFKLPFKEKEAKKIGIVDHSKKLIPFLESTDKYDFIQMDSTQAVEKVMSKDIDGFIIIPEDPDASKSIYFSLTVEVEIDKLAGILTSAAIKNRLCERGLEISLAEELRKRIYITPKKITKKGEKSGGGLIVVGISMVIFLYMFIVFASQLMARSAVEEKLNGMIELILPDISPSKLLLGKLLGVTASLLCIATAWFLVGFTVIGNAVYIFQKNIAFTLPTGILFYFIAAFLLGYTLYTSFILLFVSSVSSEQEVNQAMSVGVIVIMIPYFLTFFWVIKNPNSLVSVVSSLIPFFTPLVMPMRLSIATVSLWQAILSLFLLAVSTWGILILAGKVYRLSMLMVGKPLRLSEIIRLIRMK